MVERRSICQICKCDCGIIAEIEGGRVVKIRGDAEDPNNRGKLCIKGRNYDKVINHHERLKTPLLNVGERGEPEWREISWDKALDLISEKLRELQKEGIPESLIFLYGPSGRIVDVSTVRRFANVFGTPNVTGSWAYCVGPMVLASKLLFGVDYLIGDFANSKLIVLWGTNPLASRIHRYQAIIEELVSARKRAKIVVIDPRKSETAKIADYHLKIKPGTDIYLALSLINYLIENELFDSEFVERHVSGFDELTKAVRNFSLELVKSKTDIPSAIVEEVAEMLGKIKPAAIDVREGILHHPNAFQTARAIAALAAITGNVDVEGGLIWNPSVRLNDITLGELLNKKPFWKDKFPLARDGSAYLSEAILSDGLKVLIVFKSNPVLTLPDTKRLIKALKRLDLIVVHDIFLTATCKYADVVLPASTFLEKVEIDAVPLKRYRWIRIKRAVVKPIGSRSEAEVIISLAKKMGYESYFPYDSEEDILKEILKGSEVEGYEFEKLERGVMLENRAGLLREKGFLTPSGKIELFPDILKRMSVDKIAECEHEDAEYPYLLITGARRNVYYHTQFRNIRELRRLDPEPFAEVGERIGEIEGIDDGDRIKIITKFGEIEIGALITEIHPLTVSIPHGWEECNANLLTSSVFEPLSGAPMYRGIPCRVELHRASKERSHP